MVSNIVDYWVVCVFFSCFLIVCLCFLYFYCPVLIFLLFLCLFSKRRERGGLKLDRWGDGKDLREDREVKL